jgi:ATP-dependent 26S proteasome regulatory subunit
VKVKKAIEILQKYNLEEDIFFDVYSRADLDYLGDEVKEKITDEMMTAIYETMDNWATTDDFNDAVRIVLSENGVNDED